MGSGNAKVLKGQYYLLHLKENNMKFDPRIQPIENPNELEKQQLIDTLSQSYQGDQNHMPEGALQWVIQISNQNNYEYDSYYKMFSAFMINFTLKYGLIYVIRNDTSQEIQGLSCLFPPMAIEKGELYSPMRIISTMWNSRNYKPNKCINQSKTDDVRLDAFFQYCKKGVESHASMPHWNLYALAVKPKFQGQGIGKAFMQMFCNLSDLDNQPGFLQCTGSESTSLYFQKYGFQQIEKFNIQHQKKSISVKCNQQSSYMLRKPNEIKLYQLTEDIPFLD